MIKFFFLFFSLFVSTFSFSQVVYPYQEIKLQTPADYKDAIPMAKSAATFILTTPFSATDKNRKEAVKFLSSWMAGNKEYIFQSLPTLQDIAEDQDLSGLFIAAMSKFAFENKALTENVKMMDDSARKTVLEYCDNPANNFKLKKKYRKWLQ
ncbi:MAG: hypothetical protein WDM90_25055 [Ferruginibacter sp.]